MRIKEIEDRYSSWRAAADAIGISPQLMSKLKREQDNKGKEIPITYQIKWEVATQGALKADIPDSVRTQRPEQATA